MDAAHHTTCRTCNGPLRYDGTIVADPHYMRDRQCYECWLFDLLPPEIRGLEWAESESCPKSGIPWLDVKSPKLREQARLLPCARKPK